MLEIRVHHKAKQDLEDIYIYSFHKWGEKQADKYFNNLNVSINDILSNNPKIGFSCDYIKTGYRQYQVGEHLIFYKISSSKIHIIRLLHKSMQLKKHLG